jgi:hypothetical protein
MTLQIDKKMIRTRNGIIKLHSELGIKPTKGAYRCCNFNACRRSLRVRKRQNVITGSWPYVGVGYGKALISGKEMRIVVVGMDAGGIDDASLNFYRRQNQWRCAFEYSIKFPGSPHPVGTTLLLRELVDDKRENRFARQFVFINAVKCTRKNGVMTSVVKESMCKACESILSREINILEPDIIITQGSYPREMVKRILNPGRRIFEKDGFLIYTIGNTIVLATPHPTRHIPWKRGILPKNYCKAVEKVRNNLLPDLGTWRVHLLVNCSWIC